MLTPEIPLLKQRISDLVQSRNLSAATRAVESFMNRLKRLEHRIHQLPYEDRNAMQSVLYRDMEKVLGHFEQLEWLGPQSGPVSRRHVAAEAIHAFGIRSDKIDGCLERLPIVEKLATSAVLHGELEEVVKLFECHAWLRKRHVDRNIVPQSQLHWN